jgi:hypothetical protein
MVVARYEHLPIYKKAMDLTIYFEKIVRNFSRYNKYTLGSELREKSREIVGLIIKANSTTVKRPLLLELRERLEGLKVLIRICKEVKAFITSPCSLSVTYMSKAFMITSSGIIGNAYLCNTFSVI